MSFNSYIVTSITCDRCGMSSDGDVFSMKVQSARVREHHTLEKEKQRGWQKRIDPTDGEILLCPACACGRVG